MADQPKTPLKVDQSCSNFHRILSFHHIMKLHWAEDLKGDIKNFSFGVWGWSAPLKGGCQICHNLLNLKPLFNFLHVLKLKGYFKRIWSITSLKRNYFTQILL